ncbi:uncharacterized protein METZ01_LOCUS505567, partial [marine metagenome]
MRNSFTAIVAGFVLTFALAVAATQVTAQAVQSAEPFKVATFTVDGQQLIGLVLRDQLVVEIDAANDNLEQNPAYPEMAMPDDMLG